MRNHHARSLLVLCLALAAHGLLVLRTAAAESYPVIVEAGGHPRDASLVAIEVPQALQGAERLSLTEPESRTEIPLQRDPHDPSRALFLLNRPLEADESRPYVLQAGGRDDRPEAMVRAVTNDRGIVFERHGRTVLQYNSAVIEPPEGVDAKFGRSGHVHPVWTPGGRMVTEEFPADHLHQHGFFAAWVNTTFEGRSVDFWNQAGGTGTVEHVSVESTHSGDVFAEMTASLRHTDLTAPDGPRPVLNESWMIRVYGSGARLDETTAAPDWPAYFLFEIESTQSCAGESSLTVNEYHYGGMAWRGPAEWLGAASCEFLTSEGLSRADGNHSRPDWVCAYGAIDGEECCLAIFCHPDNFRAPQPVRLHPDKPYFVFTPPVLGAFEIAPGEPMRNRYRYVVHDGLPDAAFYERLWRDYSEPPTATLTVGDAR